MAGPIRFTVCLECAANNLAEQGGATFKLGALGGALILLYFERRRRGDTPAPCRQCGRVAILCALERGALTGRTA